jgi:hypothetical protein
VRDALTDEEGKGLIAVPGVEHHHIERAHHEVDRGERHMRRECPEAPRDDGLLLGLRCGVVHFKDARQLDTRDSIGAAIEASAQDHDLVHPAAERSTEDIIDVSRSDCHRASGPRPVPIDERPWHGGTDHWKSREAQRAPEAPSEKRGCERVLEESCACGARGLHGPVKGDQRGGSADGLVHPADLTSDPGPRNDRLAPGSCAFCGYLSNDSRPRRLKWVLHAESYRKSSSDS